MHKADGEGPRRPVSGAAGWSRKPKRIADLDISVTEDGCVVSKPGHDAMHYLNPTAVLVLELCNGQHSPEQIAELVKEAYGLPDAPVGDVHEALKRLKAEGLLA